MEIDPSTDLGPILRIATEVYKKCEALIVFSHLERAARAGGAFLNAGRTDHLAHKYRVFACGILFINKYRLVGKVNHGVEFLRILVEPLLLGIAAAFPRAQAFGVSG